MDKHFVMETQETIITEKKTEQRERPVHEIYERAFPRVAAFVSNKGGSFGDARDVFHDALVIYFEAASENRSPVHSSEEAYILGISKHLWLKKHKKERLTILMSGMEKEISIPDDYFPTAANNRLLRILESAGKKCMELLRAFYYQNVPVKKLAGMFGYASEHSVSVQKYKCLEKVRNTVKEKSLGYEDLTQ
jgi:DNA-directed RNA polymerase specialized sigma24 family protein